MPDYAALCAEWGEMQREGYWRATPSLAELLPVDGEDPAR